MVNRRLEAQWQTIKHYWSISTCSAKEIYEIISIPLRTVENNLKKLKETGDVKYKQGNGHLTKITQEISHIIEQNICHNNAISTCQLTTKIKNIKDISICHTTVWRHMKKKNIAVLYL